MLFTVQSSTCAAKHNNPLTKNCL